MQYCPRAPRADDADRACRARGTPAGLAHRRCFRRDIRRRAGSGAPPEPMSPADRIELRHVRAFLALAQELNFRSAAARLHITEPPLSRTIAQLEDVLGARLFERTSRHCELTDAGQRLVEPASRLVRILEEEFRPSAGAAAPSVVRLGVVIYSNPLKVEKLRIGLEAKVGRKVEVRFGRTHELERMLAKGYLDHALVQRPLHSTAGGAVRLATADLVVGLQAKHGLASRESLRLQDLFVFPNMLFLNRKESPHLFDYIDGEIVKLAGRPPAYIWVKEMFEAQALIAAGAACALVPETVKGFTQDEIAIRPLASADRIRVDMCLLSRSAEEGTCMAGSIREMTRDFLVADCGLVR